MFEFILNCFGRFHKLGIVQQHEVEFFAFQLHGDPNQWWRSHVECHLLGLPPMTWAQFDVMFLEKYILSG